jgi:serine/threonine protein kinase
MDIKTDNIMIDSNLNLKLIDFGMSEYYNPKLKYPKLIVGTPFCISPEFLTIHRAPHFDQDIWGAGLVFLILAFL